MDRSTEFSREFGRRVREKRMALGMPQHVLGDRLGVPQGHICRMEQGQFIFMFLEGLAALAAALHTSVDYLLGQPGARPALLPARPRKGAPKTLQQCLDKHLIHHPWCVYCRERALDESQAEVAGV